MVLYMMIVILAFGINPSRTGAYAKGGRVLGRNVIEKLNSVANCTTLGRSDVTQSRRLARNQPGGEITR